MLDGQLAFKKNSHPIVEFADHTTMKAYAAQSKKNQYMLTDGFDEPIMFMDLFCQQEDSLYFFIRQPDGEIIAAASINEDENKISVEGISRHQDHPKEGLATHLLINIMGYAEEKGKTLYLDDIWRDGLEFMKKTLPDMHHSHFPHLNVQIGNLPEINGEKLYKFPNVTPVEDYEYP